MIARLGQIGKIGRIGGVRSAPKAVDTRFIFSVTTTTANEYFYIPCVNVGTFDAIIDWGDGQTSTATTFNSTGLAHTFAAAGTHRISVSGTLPNVKFSLNSIQAQKVTSVENLGDVGWLSLASGFQSCSNMTSFNTGYTVQSGVTDYSWMFQGCSSLLNAPNVSGWVDANTTAIAGLFHGCSTMQTAPILSSWDTSSCASFGWLFSQCASMTGLKLDTLNISSLTTAASMLNSGSMVAPDYDATLISWEQQAAAGSVTGVGVSFGSSKYTAAAAAARASLVNNYGWTITDGGLA